nr:potassium-transporting ATPase subunit KdpA [Candidatus Brachybacter algidus]
MFPVTLLLAIPLGANILPKYMQEKRLFSTPFSTLFERLFYKISCINVSEEMNSKQHLSQLLCINLIWFLLSMGPRNEYEYSSFKSR